MNLKKYTKNVYETLWGKMKMKKKIKINSS